jgi:hypothetical protein
MTVGIGSDLLTKSRRQRSMFCGIVQPRRGIEMRSSLNDVARMVQRYSPEAMPHHERDRRSLLFSKCQGLRRKLTYRITIE